MRPIPLEILDCEEAYQHDGSHMGVQRLCYWKRCRGGHVPYNAVCGGEDLGGESLYVGRASHSGDLVPGKLVPSHGVCYVSWGEGEHGHDNYEVLVSNDALLQWLRASNGSVPSGAIQGGVTVTGERLYIGRARHHNTLTLGKVHPSHGCLYLPFAGNEHRYTEYEALVCMTINF
ncbi:natterin-4-like [Amblyomma americanum]